MPAALTINGAAGGSTITLNDGAGDYGSFYSTSNTMLTLSNLTITGGGGPTSAAIGTYSGASLTLDLSGSVTFSGNAITGLASGAALYSNGSMIINGGATFTNNTVIAGTNANYGGAVFAQGALTFTDSSQTIVVTDNSAYGGGGLNSGGALTIAGGLLLDNNIANTSNGGGIRTVNGNVSIGATAGDVTVTRNRVTHGGAYGGGIFVGTGNVSIGNSAGTVTIGGSVANANTATAAGGGIYAGNGMVVITGKTVTVSYNKATAGNGGGVYASGGVTVNGALTANSNSAMNGSGGAINAQAGGVAIIGAISADGNTASDRGGVIYAASGDVRVTGTGTGNIVGLTGNSAANSGGALYAQTGNVLLNGAYGSVTISGNKTTVGVNSNGGALSTFTGNISFTPSSAGDVTIARNTATGGGGAFYGKAGITINPSQAGKLVVSDNVADGYGGGAFATSGTNAHITLGGAYDSLLFSNNRATTGYGGVFTVSGGTGSNVNVNVTTAGTMEFSDNYAKLNGGAINAEAATIGGGYGSVVFDGNVAETGHGGAIHGNAVTIDTATSGTFSMTDNRAGQYGGAINTYNAQILGSYGAIQLDGNTAAAAGGAIHGTSAIINTTTIGSLEMTNNKAGLSGGAIDTNAAQILGRYGSITITGNTAVTTGGAINSNTGDITVNSTVAGTLAISRNTAGQGGAFAADNGNIAVFGGYGGILVDSNKALTGNGGALYASGNVTLDASSPATFSGNSAAGNGGAIWAGNTVTLVASAGDITFTGNREASGANAIYLNNTAGTGEAVFDSAAGSTITFYDPVESNPANGLVSVIKSGDGIVSFDGSLYGADTDRWSKVYGKTDVQAGTFEVANDAVYGALSTDVATPTAATSFISAAGSTVQGGKLGTIIADTITLNGDVSIAGRHAPATDYSVLNLSTNALTLGGGKVLFNTYLNDGVVQNTDLLVLNLHGSATSGTSFITVASVGGTGAWTIGNGIKLIETNGTGTTAEAFVLGNRVVSGAYEYKLFHGGIGNDANDENWYLRNVFVPSPSPSGCETTNTCEPTPLPVVPYVRDEVPVSMVIPPLAIEYGYAMLDTLHERVGETDLHKTGPATEERVVWCKDASQSFHCVVRVPVATANGAGKDETRWASSGWARLIGDRGLHQPDNFFRRGPNYDYTFGGIQAGLDIFARERQDGTLDKAGLYVGYGQITSNVKGQFGAKAGSVDMDAYTVAGYWTHYSPSGWYSDAVVQGTWYSADAKSVWGTQMKPDGFGILGSLEGGYSVKFGNNWTLEPQAQIVYQNVSFDHFRTEGAFVRFDDGDSLRGRLGLRLTKTWNTAESAKEPRVLTAWLRANVWHEFLGKSKTSWGSLTGQNMTPFNSYLGGTWGEIGAGVTAQVSDRINIFATGAYNRSLDNKGREAWDGRLGATVKW